MFKNDLLLLLKMTFGFHKVKLWHLIWIVTFLGVVDNFIHSFFSEFSTPRIDALNICKSADFW